MVFKNELYPIHFYGRVRGKCDGRLQKWPGIANERPKFLAMCVLSLIPKEVIRRTPLPSEFEFYRDDLLSYTTLQ